MTNIYQVEVLNSKVYVVLGETEAEAQIQAREQNRLETCAKITKTKILTKEAF